MSDRFQGHSKGLESPADTHFAITPADGADLVPRPRAIYCQTTGTVAVMDRTGAVVAYAVQAGQVLPFRAMRVMATGTTATVVGWE